MHHIHKRSESVARNVLDVIVVGAGLSGLSAAKLCHDKGLNVLVLEARDRVGGRTLSDESGSDFGGSYFSKEHSKLVNLIAELGLKWQPDLPPVRMGVSMFYSNGLQAVCRKDPANSHRLPFTNRFNLMAHLDFVATKSRINSMCAELDIHEPWNSRQALLWDSMTFRQFIEETCLTASVKKFFLNFFTPVNMTNEAEDCSLLFVLTYIRGWGGVQKCIGMPRKESTPEPFRRVVGGSQQISKRLCQQIGEERVLLNKPVHTIDQQTNSDLVSLITKDGTHYEAYRVIVSLAPSLQTAISFKPNLPPIKTQLNHRTPPGLCSKIILYYDRAYWFDEGLNGNMYIINDYEKSNRRKSSRKSFHHSRFADDKILNRESVTDQDRQKRFVQQLTKDNYCPVSFVTPDYSQGQPSLIASSCAASWINYNQLGNIEERVKFLAKIYSHIICPQLAKPVAFKEFNWVDEEYSRGAYTAIMTPGTMTKFGKILREPYEKIYFASTELSILWPNTMEGAIRSGRWTAKKVLKNLKQIEVCAQLDEEEDDDSGAIDAPTFFEQHAGKFLNILQITLTTPSLLLLAAVIGAHWSRVSFRCNMSM